MLPIETAVSFLTASVLLALAPGPDNLFVLTQSAVQGRTAGLAIMLGLCTGLIGHTLSVTLGVAVIFKTSAIAFSVLKYIGAAYLAYLAWRMFRASAGTIGGGRGEEVRIWKLYIRGIVMNVTNPKVSIFFLAFLPQFAEPARGPLWIQMLMLGGLFILATILVFGAMALLAGTFGQWLNRSEGIQKIMNRTAGVVFLGLALKLAATRQ
ncbi:MAG: LysE family translocator [Thermodesulfobacteriota bacterium]